MNYDDKYFDDCANGFESMAGLAWSLKKNYAMREKLEPDAVDTPAMGRPIDAAAPVRWRRIAIRALIADGVVDMTMLVRSLFAAKLLWAEHFGAAALIVDADLKAIREEDDAHMN